MTEKALILVVEDELTSRAMLSGYLKAEGYQIREAENGEKARAAFAQNEFDLIMLDIRLPDDDGLTLLKEIRRQSDVGIIMVTGKSDDVDRIVALEMEADDYVMKPFNPRELLARAKNVIRRVRAARANQTDSHILTFLGWQLDLDQRCLFDPDDEQVYLTRGEFELLTALVAKKGRVLTRDNLLNHLYHRQCDPNSDRIVDVLVARLRKKIEINPKEPKLIITVHGVGYVFAASQRPQGE
ncbi:response regulator [uncultured Cohaesibacter sp.]|uniref:response regulator n=1 Tax=uncultured Cohaesibacter sp. TaxID=1002546 RepID=UPI0029307159|nr:response regulator [uncultured Cohaesibacter sp.]